MSKNGSSNCSFEIPRVSVQKSSPRIEGANAERISKTSGKLDSTFFTIFALKPAAFNTLEDTVGQLPSEAVPIMYS